MTHPAGSPAAVEIVRHDVEFTASARLRLAEHRAATAARQGVTSEQREAGKSGRTKGQRRVARTVARMGTSYGTREA